MGSKKQTKLKRRYHKPLMTLAINGSWTERHDHSWCMKGQDSLGSTPGLVIPTNNTSDIFELLGRCCRGVGTDEIGFRNKGWYAYETTDGFEGFVATNRLLCHAGGKGLGSRVIF